MVKIFIGTSPGNDDKDAETVLEYTLRKNCSEPLEIIFMRNNSDPENFFSGFNDREWKTPFSYLRLAIPEYCNFSGRAIYMDVDQVNFKDISLLFNMDLQGKSVALREGDLVSCVMVMDCEKLKERIPPVKELKSKSADELKSIVNSLSSDCVTYDKRWNSWDGWMERSANIWHLHFTELETQPWAPSWAEERWWKNNKFETKNHPRGDLVYIWKYLLEEAKNNV